MQKKHKELLKTSSHKNFEIHHLNGKKRLEKTRLKQRAEMLNNIKEQEVKNKIAEEKRLRVEYTRNHKSTGMKDKYKSKSEQIKKFKEEQSQEREEFNETYLNKYFEKENQLIEREKELKSSKDKTLRMFKEKLNETHLRIRSMEIKERENKESIWSKLEQKSTQVSIKISITL